MEEQGKPSRLVAHYKATGLPKETRTSMDRYWRIPNGTKKDGSPKFYIAYEEELALIIEGLGGMVEKVEKPTTYQATVNPEGFEDAWTALVGSLVDPQKDWDASGYSYGGTLQVYTPVAQGASTHLERCAKVEAFFERFHVGFEKECVTEHGDNVCRPVPRALIEAALPPQVPVQ